MTDAQSDAFRLAEPADWGVPADFVAIPDAAEPLSREEWWDIGWDHERTDPLTPAQARRELHARVHDPSAPDGFDDLGAYDDLVPDDSEDGRHGTAGRILGVGNVWAKFLPDAAKWAGLPVVLVPGWETRGHAGFRALEGVVGHHTGTAQTAKGDYPSQNIVTVGRSDLAGPLCNVGLARSGTVYVVAAGVAWHAGASAFGGYVDLNSTFLGIEAESAGGGLWTDAQRAAYPRLVAGLLHYINRPTSRYCSHRTCATPAGRKPDPTGIADQWMRDQAGTVMGGLPVAPIARPTVKGKANMIANYDIPPGKGTIRKGWPVGSASSIYARGWAGVTSNGPRPGSGHIYAQRSNGKGVNDAAFSCSFVDGGSSVGGMELGDGSWQVAVNYDLPDGGTLTLEALPKS